MWHKAICINNDKYPNLTKGKIYNIKYSTGPSIEVSTILDNGNIGYLLMSRFKLLSEMRNDKIDSILDI